AAGRDDFARLVQSFATEEWMEAYLRRTVLWYGGLSILAASVVRNLALPPAYLQHVVHEIEVMGVRSLGVALVAAVFTGMVFALQSAINMARFGAEAYVGPVSALAILRELGPVLAGMIIMNLERGADMYTYWNVTTYWVVPRDFLMGVGKSFFFGGIVTLIGCYNGLSVEGGTEGLGRATTATVVHVTMGVIVSD